jgi:hypothetical protein
VCVCVCVVGAVVFTVAVVAVLVVAMVVMLVAVSGKMLEGYACAVPRCAIVVASCDAFTKSLRCAWGTWAATSCKNVVGMPVTCM